MRARADFYNGVPAHPRSWTDAFQVTRFSIVLAGSMIVGTLTGTIDKLMLGYFTIAQDVGQYSLVQTLVVLIGLIGVAFNQSLAALVAERYAHGDIDGMVRVMSLNARWVTLASLPIFAIFLFWGAQLTLLLGPSFATSQTVVGWLAVSQFLVTVFSPSGWALSMTGKHVLELKILLVGLVIATLLCWLAVPVVGQLGAAVATCASLAVVNLGRNLFVRHLVGVFPFGSDIFVIMAAGIGLAWGGQVMVAQIALSPLWNTIAGIGFFLVAYGIVSWTQLLNESEKSGIFRAIKSTRQKLLGRTR
jgi:O-antigen/teichoic acid export membrane protein